MGTQFSNLSNKPFEEAVAFINVRVKSSNKKLGAIPLKARDELHMALVRFIEKNPDADIIAGLAVDFKLNKRTPQSEDQFEDML